MTMTRAERRAARERGARILEQALAIARAEEAARVFDPDTCALCESTTDLVSVMLRSGWGRTRSKWYGPRTLCRSCRGDREGHWKYVKRPVKAKPDTELGAIQVESGRVTADF